MRQTLDFTCRPYWKNRYYFNLRSRETLFLFQSRSFNQTYPFLVLQSNPSVSFCAELGGVAESIPLGFHDFRFRDFARNDNASTNRALHSSIIRELLKVLNPLLLGKKILCIFHSEWGTPMILLAVSKEKIVTIWIYVLEKGCFYFNLRPPIKPPPCHSARSLAESQNPSSLLKGLANLDCLFLSALFSIVGYDSWSFFREQWPLRCPHLVHTTPNGSHCIFW